MSLNRVSRSVMVIVACGLVVSFVIFSFLKSWEEEMRMIEFQNRASNHAAAIEAKLEGVLKTVESSVYFIEYNLKQQHADTLKSQDFISIAQQTLAAEPALLSVVWSVVDKDVGNYPYLRVVHIEKNSELSSDVQVDDYYDEHINEGLELDGRAGLQTFIHVDNPLAGNELSIINFVSSQVQQGSDLNGEVLGALVVELHVARVIEDALLKLPVAAQDITLLTFDEDGGGSEVYFHQSRSRSAGEQGVHTGLKKDIGFELAGRKWKLEFEAAPEFLRNHPIMLAWPSMLIGLLLTFFMAWYVRYKGGQAARIEAEVVSRTQQLNEVQSLLKSVLNHSPAVIFVKDIVGRYVLVNERYESLFQISQAEIIGKTDADVFDEDLAKILRENDLSVIESGKSTVVEEAVPDQRGIRYYYSLKFPLLDADNNIYAVCGIATDITEQKQASAQIAKLALVVEQTDEMVLLTDAQGVIEYVNPAFERISGFSSVEAIGCQPSLVKSGLHSDQLYQSMWHCLLSGKSWKGEFTNRNKQGDLYDVSQTITPIINDQGEVTGFASVQRDMTDYLEMQRKLQHTDRVESLGVLAGGIAHDFNNLLTAMLGNVSLAKGKLESNSPLLRHLESIEKASLSAADLCRQMLAYSGKGQFVVKAVNLSELLENMGKLLDVSLGQYVVLEYHLNQNVPLIEVDVAQMQQIALNLITNASEAIEDKHGLISMSVGEMMVDEDYLSACVHSEYEPGRYVYMEVSDTGCGMDDAVQKKIFDPFFTTKFAGRGLGMSAMLGIVQAHKGLLHIDSKLGQGTTVKVAFPVSSQIIPAVEVADPPAVLWRGAGIVLIIDDEETIREVAKVMFEELGYQVISADSGAHGIELFKQFQSDIMLVLLDMTMPKMNGAECFDRLRQIAPDVRVILSSGYNEQDISESIDCDGLLGFIQKPYSLEALAKKLQALQVDD